MLALFGFHGGCPLYAGCPLRIFEPPPDVALYSLLSFVVLLCVYTVAPKLRSLHFTHPVYVASRYFHKTHPSLFMPKVLRIPQPNREHNSPYAVSDCRAIRASDREFVCKFKCARFPISHPSNPRRLIYDKVHNHCTIFTPNGTYG